MNSLIAATDTDSSNSQKRKMITWPVSNEEEPEAILKRRKQRFGEIPSSENKHLEVLNQRKNRFNSSRITVNKVNMQSEVLNQRRHRFNSSQIAVNKVDVSKDHLNVLQRRKERFGEVTSSLLKSIEEKEKMLKRQARFGSSEISKVHINEHVNKRVQAIKSENGLNEDAFRFSTVEQIEARNALKKTIKLEDNSSPVSEILSTPFSLEK